MGEDNLPENLDSTAALELPMPMITRGVVVILFATIKIIGAAGAAGPKCAPVLMFKDVRFSEMRPPTLERKWTAIVSVDASRCQENSSGYFEIIFTRLSEVAPDLEFRERYAWRPPSVEVAVNFAAMEAVGRYRLENITSCVCRD
jgi:hypothetical protein